jgi:pimeloyl-ACP methyl ester carboxylesterase
VGGAELAYRVVGDGPALLLIMGHTGSMDQWPLAVVNSLARDRRVIVYDHRGMGDSSSPPGEWTIEQLADDAAGLLASLGIALTDVLGWSMGGLVAQELAFRHPGLVRRMVLVATSPGGSAARRPDQAVLDVLHDDSIIGAERGRRVWGLMVPQEFAEAFPAFIPEVARTRRAATRDDALRQWRAIESWRGSWDLLPTLVIPVLLVTGTCDVVTPPDNSLRMAERIPGSWLVRMDGGGHGVIYQYPGRFTGVVRAFLE